MKKTDKRTKEKNDEKEMSALGTLEEIMDIGEKLCTEYSKRIDEMKEGTCIEAFKENLESIRTMQQQRELKLREAVKRLTNRLAKLEDETKRLRDENGASTTKAIADLVNSKNAAFEKLDRQIARRKDIYSRWESEECVNSSSIGVGSGDGKGDDTLFELEAAINNLETVMLPMLYKKLSFLLDVSKIIFRDETLKGTGVQISGCKRIKHFRFNFNFIFIFIFLIDSFCGCESSGDLKSFSFNSASTTPVEKADYLWSLIN